MTATRYVDAPNKTVDVGGTPFAYRELGAASGVPVIVLNHLAAVMDDLDPSVIDGIAAKHRVIAFDNRGIGGSGGSTPDTVEAMAGDAIAFVRAMGLTKVDLLGFSLGGFVAQVIAKAEPELVRKMILTGTGPAGGIGIDKVTRITFLDMLRGFLTFKNPKHYLFFTTTANGQREAAKFIKRLNERTKDRDKPVSVRAFLTQLKAIRAWAEQQPTDLSVIRQPVFVANGDQDRMVPTSNSYDLAKRLPNSVLKIYPDAGHGGIFQFHDEFVAQTLDFLAS